MYLTTDNCYQDLGHKKTANSSTVLCGTCAYMASGTYTGARSDTTVLQDLHCVLHGFIAMAFGISFAVAVLVSLSTHTPAMTQLMAVGSVASGTVTGGR